MSIFKWKEKQATNLNKENEANASQSKTSCIF